MTHQRGTVRLVEVGALRLGCREFGDPACPPAVLLHGSGSSARTWERFAGRLTAAGYRSIAVDLRGHGTSDRAADYSLGGIAADVVSLLDVLGLRDAVLVGHSVGGYAALAAARLVPHRVARLVLEDLAAPPQQSTPMRLTDLPKLLRAGPGIFARPRDYDLRAVTSILRQLSRPDPAWWASLPEVHQPTLLLSGGPTSCIPPKRLSAVCAALRNATLETIPVGHRIHSLSHDTFTTEVLDFLAPQRSAGSETVRAEELA